MSSVLLQLCPLCGKASQAEFIDSSKRKRIKCRTCNEFLITPDAEKHPGMSSSDVHKELSAIARSSSQNQILEISVKSNALYSIQVLRPSVIR
jgi:hypothetical protein